MEKVSALLKVALRQQAVFIPDLPTPVKFVPADEHTLIFVADLVKLGYQVSEELLSALQLTTPEVREKVLENIREAKGVGKNWTPLVKNWVTPTNESPADYIMTFFANVFKRGNEPTLPCGHYIPKDTFPLERYHGCPFCGTPFEFQALELHNKGSKKVILAYWSEAAIKQLYVNLLLSKTALDATQVESLKTLMAYYPWPAVKPAIKETLMLVVDILLENKEQDMVQQLLTSPNEILRYLWYKHTGFLQIIKPATIIKRNYKNNQHFHFGVDNSAVARVFSKASLELKYSRETGRMVAGWLNNLPLPVEKMCEDMHPKRGMWIRFIRALRLSESAKRPGFEKLRDLLDAFYHERYEVHAGAVQQYRLRKDADHTLKLLQTRPGLFARSLFANMLWFGPETVLAAFAQVMDKVPARLVFTLAMYAETYFEKYANRTVKPLGGVAKVITPNKLLKLFSDKELHLMKDGVKNLTLQLMKTRFASVANEHKTIYIAPALFNMPLSIGDRSETIQDLPSALQGTRFQVEGDTVRLFMQWGQGLPSQRLDMDLSCSIAYDGKEEICNFRSKYPTGCAHSGDVITIPHMVGTAEYINLDLPVLRKAGAKFVTFTCNAYSTGSIAPNLVVGWMDSKYEMTVTDQGVAYDPSCVQHQVRIGSGLSKGLVFGILDIEANEIIWMEMPFQGQVVGQLSSAAVRALLYKLTNKLSIGDLLRVKADAQQLSVVDSEALADEAYTLMWARDAAAVTQLFID